MEKNKEVSKQTVMLSNDDIYCRIATIIEEARNNAYKAVNSSILMCYWTVGKVIAEYEQNGKEKAEYGKYLLTNLGDRLNKEYGAGFDRTNLNRMRMFYLAYPIRDAVRHELTWTV